MAVTVNGDVILSGHLEVLVVEVDGSIQLDIVVESDDDIGSSAFSDVSQQLVLGST